MPHLNRIVLSALASILCAASGNVSAGQLGHYIPSIINVRDLFVPAAEGVYYGQYNTLYSTDTLKNRDGDTVGTIEVDGPLGTTTLNVEPDLDMFSVAPLIAWSSPWKILGARYGAMATVAIASASIDTSLSLARYGRFHDQVVDRSLEADAGGMSDLYVQPVWLGWSGKYYDASAAYGIWAPTGADGISMEYWQHQFQATGAWYPFGDHRMAVMVGSTYEIGHERQDRDLTPGDRFTLNWGISQYLPLKHDLSLIAELGIRGYSQWQVEADSGADVLATRNRTLNAKDQIHSAGLQVGLTFPTVGANLNFYYMWEFGAEARFEGEWLGLSFAKGF